MPPCPRRRRSRRRSTLEAIAQGPALSHRVGHRHAVGRREHVHGTDANRGASGDERRAVARAHRVRARRRLRTSADGRVPGAPCKPVDPAKLLRARAVLVAEAMSSGGSSTGVADAPRDFSRRASSSSSALSASLSPGRGVAPPSMRHAMAFGRERARGAPCQRDEGFTAARPARAEPAQRAPPPGSVSAIDGCSTPRLARFRHCGS